MRLCTLSADMNECACRRRSSWQSRAFCSSDTDPTYCLRRVAGICRGKPLRRSIRIALCDRYLLGHAMARVYPDCFLRTVDEFLVIA